MPIPAQAPKHVLPRALRTVWALCFGLVLTVPAWAQSESTVGQWYFEALRRKESGDIAGAIKVYQKIRAKDPQSFAAAYSLAELHALNMEYPRALELAQTANTLDRTNLWAWRLTKSLLEEAGQNERALDCVDSLTKYGQHDVEAYLEAAGQAAHFGRRDRAEHFAAEAIRWGGKTPELESIRSQWFLPDEPEKALEILKQAVADFPDHPELEGQYGSLLQRQNRWAEAEAVFVHAQKRNPEDGRAAYMLYQLYRRTDRPAEASIQAQKVLASENMGIDSKVQMVSELLLNPQKSISVDDSWALAVLKGHGEDPKAWTLAADIANHLKLKGLAAQRWRHALSLPGGDFWPLHVGLLQADEDLKDSEALIRDAQSAQWSYPLQSLAYYYEGRGHQMRADWTSAERLYRTALRYAQSAPEIKSEIQMQLGETLHRLKKYAECDVLFEELLARDTAQPVAYNNYAYFLAVRGEKLDRAEQYAQKAIQISARGGQKVPYTFWDTLAWVYHRAGKKEAAWAALERCWTDGGSEDPAVQKHRAAMESAQP